MKFVKAFDSLTLRTFAKAENLITNKLEYCHVTVSKLLKKHGEENRVETR